MTSNFPTNIVTPSVKPFESFAFDSAKPATVPTVTPVAIPAASGVEGDKVETDKVEIKNKPEENLEAPEKAPKKGVIQGAKDVVRTVRKFGVTVSEYTKGTFKGIFDGALVGGGIFAIGKFANFTKKHAKDIVKNEKKYYKLNVEELLKTLNTPEAQADDELKTVYNLVNKISPKKNAEGLIELSEKAVKKLFKELKEVKLPEKLYKNAGMLKKVRLVPVKTLAVIGSVVTLAATYWNTSLKANKKKADVDHKYTTTPIVSK